MSSPHKPLPKSLRVAKMSVRPTWRKKLNRCNSSNEVDVNLPTPMLKPQSPINEPTTHSNHVSLQSYSLPLSDSCDTNVIKRISLTGFPAQSVGTSNTYVSDSPCLLVLITGTSQSRQYVNTSSNHIEFLPSPTMSCLMLLKRLHLHCEYLSITQMFWQDLKDNA
ncbi:hypothetical protein Tco_1143148 [Tanacetum coccineum]